VYTSAVGQVVVLRLAATGGSNLNLLLLLLVGRREDLLQPAQQGNA